ncbi:LysR family transcriptional regulator [Paraburkholderia phytofirmans OLGA172]|uniref:LysR family transcriptional regulator n=1 Tax=Paraburkholderia phytofirmans OLGA172 TaxID=1417228 RepID=A0A160FW14_9BURK|nr:LysR family transcriptional regulator [Paraburkholderia phytofirmans]ANB77589.1 LysR family transcriptional regulator [Paraburkholderia phytofirmans OLGA172]
MDKWMEVQLFLQTAELGSVSKAAETLGMSSSAGSRHLVNLEQRLGARLVERNTRRLFLTEVGEEFYRRCLNISSEMEEAESLVSSALLSPVGTLRVTASVSFCAQIIAPLLPEFTRRHPNISVSITAANRYFDIIENGIDVAIRTREHDADSGIVTRRLAETRRILAASPEYLDRHGTPKTLDELSGHHFLIYTLANNPYELAFTKASTCRSIKIEGLLDSNEGQVIRQAGLNGLGILIQPTYIIHDDVIAGRLVPILDDWDLPRLKITLAYQNRQYLSLKVRAFIDFLADHFRNEEYERRWTQTWSHSGSVAVRREGKANTIC